MYSCTDKMIEIESNRINFHTRFLLQNCVATYRESITTRSIFSPIPNFSDYFPLTTELISARVTNQSEYTTQRNITGLFQFSIRELTRTKEHLQRIVYLRDTPSNCTRDAE